MIEQKIDNISFRMRQEYDFSFLKKYGKVFKVFDDQDSGNICFGIEKDGDKLFVKFAGAQTARYDGNPADAIENLKKGVSIYEELRQNSLITLLCAEKIGNGFAMVFEWSNGECMGRMYPESHKKIMNLEIDDKLILFQQIITFMKTTVTRGYVAVDFYDGSVMYDIEKKKTTICDIDYFQKSPCMNTTGRMCGSSRFMSPEEYNKGAYIDEITNVFTLGQTGFSLFTDSNREKENWPLSEKQYEVLMKAINPERKSRFQSIDEFEKQWKAI